MDELLRVYLDPSEIGADGYPYAWRGVRSFYEANGPPPVWITGPAIKDLIREQADYRCERCGHPYPPEITATCPRGEWTPCAESCTHGGPVRTWTFGRAETHGPDDEGDWEIIPDLDRRAWMGYQGRATFKMQAQWRILTTHHLNGIKHDCRWWNLAALCQRCHLAIQGKVTMERVYPWEHSEWFKPHAAGWYASSYLGEELSREQTLARLDELLDLELDQKAKYFGAYVVAEEGEMRTESG